MNTIRVSNETLHSIKKRSLSRRSRIAHAIGLVMAFGLTTQSNAQTADTDTGRLGDPASWMSAEFEADWGLSAINAQYAYARGLTGKGVQLGIFDSGVAAGHFEFAGKNINGLRAASALAGGGTCAAGAPMRGPGACFASTGDTVSVDYLDYDSPLIQALIYHGYLPPGVRDWIESTKAGARYDSHGTHVAGSMLANRDGNGMHGVAFGADLASARIFGDSYINTVAWLRSDPWLRSQVPPFYDQGVINEGLEFSNGADLDTQARMYRQMADHGVRAINHSWGLKWDPTTADDMDDFYGDYSDSLLTYAQPSLRHGMLQVWAAGNAHGNIAGVHASLPRYLPALEGYWLSVVNTDPNGVLDESSNTCGLSMAWCVAAPGTNINSTVIKGQPTVTLTYDADGQPNGMQIDASIKEYGHADYTGTSMAAPHVTGALALLMERFPYLDNPQIRDVLLTTATDLGEPGVDPIYGWGLINLRKAIEGPGQLRVDTDVVMNQRAGGVQVWQGPAWDDWSNDIGGPGKLGKSGIGWLRLSGNNSFGGASVREGVLELDGINRLGAAVSVDGPAVLRLNGQLIDTDLAIHQGFGIVNGTVRGGTTTVGEAGTLGGAGRLADTVVRGTIAPGNSIGTLTIEGDYLQQAGSLYLAELSPPSDADRLDITGHATLEGGTLRAIALPGVYALGQRYRLLSAAGGVEGQFSEVDASRLSPFLSLQLNYTSRAIGMDVGRGAALVTAASSLNQLAVASRLDALPDTAPLLQRSVSLFPQTAAAAFDGLSGEVHASAQALLAQASRTVRDSALARARAGEAQFSAQGDADRNIAAWASVQHGHQRLGADGNAAAAQMNGRTSLVGIDLQLESGWRLGALGGRGKDRIDVAARNSRADVGASHAALYAARHWGGLGLRAGVATAWQDLETERRVVLGDIREQPRAQYGARTRQAFVEAGYRFSRGMAEFEPFVQFAQVHVHGDELRESGQFTGLSLPAQTQRTRFTLQGLRLARNLAASRQSETWLSLHGSLAYRHASGDLLATRTAGFPAGGAGFAVSAAPLARNATLAEFGLAARLSTNSLLELDYSGLFASDARDTGLSARYSLKF